MLEQIVDRLTLRVYLAIMKVQPKLSPKYAGRLGGLKGGHARAEKLSPDERKAIAKKAAEARWSKKGNYKM
jgi:hypothetical protein